MDFNNPQTIWTAAIISNLVGVVYLLAALKVPRLSRLLFFLLFAWASYTNYFGSHLHPEFYLLYAKSAVPIYARFINGWFSQHITVFVSLIAIAQGIIALGMLMKGKYVKLACISAMIFLLSIAPLGLYAAFPFSVTVSLAAWFIIKNDNLDYLWHFRSSEAKKVILLINGHPSKQSFCAAVCETYRVAAEKAGHQVRLINVADMRYDPVLYEGYRSIQPLEDDLKLFQQEIIASNHIVIVYPTWWAGMPAGLKGLFDRSFLPGFAFRYHKTGPFWDKLLKGRSAHIITTMDSPLWWYSLVYRSAGNNMLKRGILEFCGIGPVKTTIISSMRTKRDTARAKELRRIEKLAGR